MNILLIPQPQYVQGTTDKLLSGLTEWDVELSVPVADSRIDTMVQSLFHKNQQSDQANQASPAAAEGIYALTTNGTAVNAQLAERVRGRYDGYICVLAEKHLELYAWSASGFYYGLKTIEQLLLNYEGHVPTVTIVDWAELKLRSDYLDLRTIYPTFEHILAYIAELSSYKMNTLVVEYEDKLPFRKLQLLRHPELALSEEQHEQLLQTAHQHFIQIIPKQQSFGHLEYILKHPAYIGFRETPESVGELCPHRSGAYEMMASILEEIAELHPHSDYLHLGCDEVWSLGTCEDCIRSGQSRESAFISFVNRLAEKSLSMGKIPMIWHDMLMHASSEELALLDKRIVVVIWIYGGHQMKSDARRMIRMLRTAGVAVIGASAVRCWDDHGEQNYPVIHNRIANILNWVELSQSEQLPGIINTNWAVPFALGSPYGLFETSRYPTFFSADLNWNIHADRSTFLERYILQYHGVNPRAALPESFADYSMNDYYNLIPQLLPAITRNRLTAEWIEAMLHYELPTRRRFPLHTFLFRGELTPDSEEVITSLKHKYKLGYTELAAARIKIEKLLEQLLPPQMQELYLMSRFYLPELIEAKLLEITGAADTSN